MLRSCLEVASCSKLTALMERKSASGLLNGLVNFKKLPDGSVDKSKVKCNLCQTEFNYHRSTSSLSYHLHAKHPGATGAAQPSEPQLHQSTILECGSRRRPVDESTLKKLTKAIAKWVAIDCRPVHIVEDSGLRDVIRLACSDPAYTLPSRGTIVTRIQELYETEKEAKMDLLQNWGSLDISE